MRRIGPVLLDDVAYFSAGLGGLVWLGTVALAAVEPIERWLLFAVLVLTPLALPRIGAADRDGTVPTAYAAAVLLQPIGAAGGLASALMVADGGSGTLPAALTLGWAAFALALATLVLPRLLARGLSPAAETLVDLAGLYPVVGAGWLLAARYGAEPLGFGSTVVRLTAVHFHYAGLVLPVVAGCVGRLLVSARGRRAFAPVAAVVGAGPALVAVGITARGVYGATLPEAVAAVVFAAAVAGIALFALAVAARTWRGAGRPVPALLLAGAAMTVVVTMALAARYALGVHAGGGPTVDEMVRTHGAGNALGFALPGLLAVALLAPAPTWRRGTPFSSLRAGRRVGPDFFERAGVAGAPADGQLSSVSVLDRADFDPDRLHPEVRRFYEHTADYDLLAEVRWHRPFRLVAALATRLGARIDQLGLPGPDSAGPHRVTSRLLDLGGDDPRSDARAWVLGDADTGTALFVSASGVHEYDGVAYLSVALPLPGANLTGAFRPDALRSSSGVGDGLQLRSHGESTGDGGLFLVTPFGPVALPIRETVRVWPSAAPEVGAGGGADDPDLVATQEIRLLGRRLVTIRYGIDRAD